MIHRVSLTLARQGGVSWNLGTGVITLPVYVITINLGSGYRCRHTTCLHNNNKLGIWVQVSSHYLSTEFLMMTINLGPGYRCHHITCLHNSDKLGVWVQVLSHYLSAGFLMMTINLGSGYRCLIRCGVKTAGSDSPLFWGISGQARKSQKSIGVPSPASSLFRSSPWSSPSKSISNRKRPFSLAGLMQLNSSPQSGNQPLQDPPPPLHHHPPPPALQTFVSF